MDRDSSLVIFTSMGDHDFYKLTKFFF